MHHSFSQTFPKYLLFVPTLFIFLSPAWSFAIHKGRPNASLSSILIPQDEPAITVADTAFPSATDGEIVVTTYTPQYYTDTTAILAAPTDAAGLFNTSEPAVPSDITIEMRNGYNSPQDAQQFPIGYDGIAMGPGNLAADIFDHPIGTSEPLGIFERKNDHPVERQGIVNMDDQPVPTNRFWGNLVLGNGNLGVFTQPYVIWVSKDEGLWGLTTSHVDQEQIVFGPDPNSNPVQYYYNPVFVNSLTLSAAEFSVNCSSMTSEALKPHSALVKLWANKNHYPSKVMSAPLVQGMGFVSATYEDLIPKIQSGVGIRSFSYVGDMYGGGLHQKWQVTLNDGKQWRIYASPSSNCTLDLRLANDSLIQSTRNWSGTIQIAKLSNSAAETALDSSAGTICTDIMLTGCVSGAVGTYAFTFTKTGGSISDRCLMYALPHQVASFDSVTSSNLVNLQLKSTTKGMMQGVLANSWTLVEPELGVSIGWLPGSFRNWTEKQIKAISSAISSEINYDVIVASDLSSQYFAGKALGKYAQILLVAAEVLGDFGAVRAGLRNLLIAINRFASNKQIFPLVYDTKWKGLVSSSWWATGDQGQDFGNAFYNDHHFHYGYFIYAAAVVVHLEKLSNGGYSPWLESNKEYVMNLIRDTANPTVKDPYFPVSRAFDFWNGHSWATGLYPRVDGKDQESTSEDYNFAYGLKLWGNVIGDPFIEARANLQLAILKRSVNAYFLMDSGNDNQPPQFIKNKVTGILFENKADHTTYFGNNIEFIQGIHMLPLTPVSPYVRNPKFVYEEWMQWFEGRTASINSGWKGVLWANVALFNPNSSFDFFNNPSFPTGWLDDGASRTWYLAFAAGLGGGQY